MFDDFDTQIQCEEIYDFEPTADDYEDFDDDTKESFLSLYTKIDADAVTDTVSDTGDNSCPF